MKRPWNPETPEYLEENPLCPACDIPLDENNYCKECETSFDGPDPDRKRE